MTLPIDHTDYMQEPAERERITKLILRNAIVLASAAISCGAIFLILRAVVS